MVNRVTKDVEHALQGETNEEEEEVLTHSG